MFTGFPRGRVAVSQWIAKLTEDVGYVGIALLMFLENVFPPIPSEVVMPVAGYATTTGDMAVGFVIVAGSLGSLAGAVFWYVIARQVGEDRLRRWTERWGYILTLSTKDVDRAMKWFQRWGGYTVLFCRMVPGLRTIISLPAGFSMMPWASFLTFTTIGTVAWTAVLAWVGVVMGKEYQRVTDFLGWISIAILAFACLWWLIRVLRQAFARSTNEN
jgi:membrane protein DedA with SNARE-associated domain